jgi:putative endonuclease
MLFCDEKTYYVGITTDLEKRINEHKNKESFFTKKFSHIKPVYCEKYKNQTEAAQREQQIKGWGRAKKQMLINDKLGINACTELLKNL